MKSDPGILSFKTKEPLWIVLIFFVWLSCFPETVISGPADNGRTFSSQLNIFLGRLIKLPESKSKTIFNEYEPIISKEIDATRLYSSSLTELKLLLDTAQKETIDVLTLFTLPDVHKKPGKAILIDEKTLLELDTFYNLHGLFLISSYSADDDSKVTMKFLIVGQGKFITGYNKNTIISHPEYTFATGIYEYQKLFMMDAAADEKGNCGLFNIRGLTDPSAKFQWLKGPLNSKIKSLSIPLELRKEKKLLVQYEFLGNRKKIVPCIPIEKW